LVSDSAPVYAWSDGGHQIVATIAYHRLTPRTRAAVDSLLKIPIPPMAITAQEKDFVSTSTWADEVRSESGFEETRSWHYIDNPFTHIPGTPIPTGLPEKENVITALNSEIAVLRNPTAKRADKARALRFLIHFVGDIHQPLHCTTRVSPLNPDGDRGGNEYYVQIPGEERTESLHALWDQGLETFPQSLTEVPRATARIEKEFPASDSGWRVGGPRNVSGWMKESVSLARGFVYNDLHRERPPSSSYLKQGERIADKRVAWAGYRLAALLNDLFSVH